MTLGVQTDSSVLRETVRQLHFKIQMAVTYKRENHNAAPLWNDPHSHAQSVTQYPQSDEESNQQHQFKPNTMAAVINPNLNGWEGLMNRIGLTNPTRDELGRQGIETLEDLETFNDDGIKTVATHMLRYPHPNRPQNVVVYMTATSIEHLKEIRYWIKLRRRIGLPLDADACTQNELEFTKERLVQLEDIRKAEENGDATKPNPLKRMTEWIDWWDSWLTYAGTIRGAADIPITYVFREEATVTQDDRDAAYAEDDDRYYRITALTGTHYLADNKRVWTELKALVQGGPGWDFIKRYENRKDGRAAALALLRQSGTTYSTTTRKNKAYKAIEELSYNGPKKHWTLEQYVNGHLKAHNELQVCGEEPPETKKVTDFLNGIADDRLQNAKDFVYGNQAMLSSFELTQQYLLSIASNKKNASNSDRGSRRVSQVDRFDTKPGKGPFKGKLEAKSYPKHVWFGQLSQTQRDKVIEMRKKSKDRDTGTNKRKTAQLKSGRDSPSDNESSDAENGGDAGNQFGRNVHERSSKKTRFSDKK